MTIAELNWCPHPLGHGGMFVHVTFRNGYTASVVKGSDEARFLTTPDAPYEVAVMRDGALDYSTPVTDEVLRNCTEAEANEALAQIEALPKPGDKT